MGMSIIDKREIIIEKTESSVEKSLEVTHHKGSDRLGFRIQEGTETASSLLLTEDEALTLGKWLIEQAGQMKKIREQT